MILAAGRGERMMPLTANRPKPLLLVHGVPLIEHRIVALKKAGITDIVINLHYLGQQIQDYLGDGKQLGVSIEYVLEENLLETAGGIRNALPLLGDDPFLVVPSDTLMDIDFSLIQNLPAESQAHLVLVNNPSHHPNGDYAIKPDGKLSMKGNKLTYSSVALYSPNYFIGLTPGRYLLRDLFEKTIKLGIVTGEFYDGYWVDVGTPKRLKEINRSK
ncbi:MAG: MurNAc alpha-1-phosphate uridylyltransferase [Candidatus Azotimanducaceae bacterium]|jgi:MurNAc alpha-1-phosphate uridylyltransferase